MTELSADIATTTTTINKQQQQPIFQDTSTDCAICLELLTDHRILTLGCGHKWHYDCLVQQLQTAQPTSTKRLLFTGCQCAKCAVICEHSELNGLTRSTDVVRRTVDQLVLEQVVLDAPDAWRRSKDNPAARKRLLEDARRNYAFYMCGHCKEPYFGGTVECADLDNDTTTTTMEEERLCVACSPESQICCENPLEHRGCLIWKCRYCCQPATHLCYGSVHFCDACHDRNSVRVQEQQQQQQRQHRTRPPPPPALNAIPCSGTTCPFPKPDNQTHHSNGSIKHNEQVYSCAWCQSASNRHPHTEEPGSKNLIPNRSGQHQLRGWRQLNPRMSWTVEHSDLPVNSTTAVNFVSSFQPCVMSHVVDLTPVLKPNCPATVEVAAYFMGRTDCPSVFRLEGVLMDRTKHPLQKLTTEPLQAPSDCWERASLRFDRGVVPHARYLTVTVIGQDSRFWQGRFGSKVAECSVRVLGSAEELARVMVCAEGGTDIRCTLLSRLRFISRISILILLICYYFFVPQ